MSSKFTLQWLGCGSRKECLKAVYLSPCCSPRGRRVGHDWATEMKHSTFEQHHRTVWERFLPVTEWQGGTTVLSPPQLEIDTSRAICVSLEATEVVPSFSGVGIVSSEVTKLVSSQNSEALWGRGCKLGKAREWWQNASSRHWEGKSLAPSNETRPPVKS